jgi:hypothetical protein
MTAMWAHVYAQYSDFAYPLALSQSGYLAHGIRLAAAAVNVVASPIWSYNSREVERLLDIDSEHEQPLQVLSLSKRATI